MRQEVSAVDLTPRASRGRPPMGADGYWFTGTLKPHQREGVDWLLTHPKAVLADDVGLGKTIQALALIGRLEEDSVLYVRTAASACRVLWLTDAALVEQTKREVERFLPTFSVLACPDPELGSDAKWRKAFDTEFEGCPDILVMSYEMARTRSAWLSHTTPALVVLDEAMKIKGGGRAFDAVVDITKSADHVLAMTATPLENNPLELYHLLRAANVPGLWPEGRFKNDYITWRQGRVDRWGNAEMVPDGWQDWCLPEVREFLAGCLLQRSAESVGLELPVLVGETHRFVTLSKAQREAYDRAAKKSVGAMEAAGKSSGVNSVLVDALLVELHKIHGEQAVVYCETLDVLDLVAKQLTDRRISFARIEGKVKESERAAAVALHRNGDARVLLGSRVLERGLNLQHCRVLISLDASWNPARERQREGRIRRIGSPHDNFRHLTLLPDTPLTRLKLGKLARKDATASAVRTGD